MSKWWEGTVHPLTDDDWCFDCGETLPCACDDHYDEGDGDECEQQD